MKRLVFCAAACALLLSAGCGSDTPATTGGDAPDTGSSTSARDIEKAIYAGGDEAVDNARATLDEARQAAEELEEAAKREAEAAADAARQARADAEDAARKQLAEMEAQRAEAARRKKDFQRELRVGEDDQ